MKHYHLPLFITYVPLTRRSLSAARTHYHLPLLTTYVLLTRRSPSVARRSATPTACRSPRTARCTTLTLALALALALALTLALALALTLTLTLSLTRLRGPHYQGHRAERESAATTLQAPLRITLPKPKP